MNKNVAIGQSGGPSAVINAALAGIMAEMFGQPGVGKVYGLRYGIDGLIKGDLADLEAFRPDASGKNEMLSLLKHTPAAYLGSCRHKLSETDTAEYDKIFENFRRNNIGYFFYIGGNDSMDTLHKLYLRSQERGEDIKMIGVPKTVDNDLVLTDHVPGYGSAAKYIATSMLDMTYDLRVYDKPSIIIAEMMGRHAGWLTAAAALAAENGSHDELMIYLPEIVFDVDKFVRDVKDRLENTPKLVLAVSEGLRFADGMFVSENEIIAERDAFGHAALAGCGKALTHFLKSNIKIKLRSVEFNVLQRSAGHCLSLTDVNESLLVGKTAARRALEGESGKVICIRRKAGDAYEIEMAAENVGDICNKEKPFPLEWITDDHFVTEDFFRYVKPLIQGEPELAMKDGLPRYISL